jgi:catechol 2,3-dioxygenase-like lactoylglutathione lyase family enzyme
MMGKAAAMKPYPVHHIHIRSTDPEGSAALWSAAFGAEVTGRAHPNGRLRVLLRLGGVPLYIEEVPAGTHAPPAPPFLGLEHIGLATDDLDASIAHLAGLGVQVVQGPAEPRPGVRIAFFGMPDGVRVELVENRT